MDFLKLYEDTYPEDKDSLESVYELIDKLSDIFDSNEDEGGKLMLDLIQKMIDNAEYKQDMIDEFKSALEEIVEQESDEFESPEFEEDIEGKRDFDINDYEKDDLDNDIEDVEFEDEDDEEEDDEEEDNYVIDDVEFNSKNEKFNNIKKQLEEEGEKNAK